MVEIEIEPCPFCGGKLVSLLFSGEPFQGWRVKCAECEAQGPVSDDHQVATRKWNERVISSPTADAGGAPEATARNRAAADDMLREYRDSSTRDYPRPMGG